MTATDYRLRVDPRLRVVSTEEILADVEAHPDAPTITDADWHRFLPHINTAQKVCSDCGGPDVLFGRRHCGPCRRRRVRGAA